MDSSKSKAGKEKDGAGNEKKRGKASSISSKSRGPSPATSDGKSGSEEETKGAASVIQHRILKVVHRVRSVMNPTPRLPVKITPKGRGTPFSFSALPDTGCTITVMSEDVQHAYGLTLFKAKEKLVAADDSDLKCVGAVFVNIDGKHVRALVSRAFCLLYTSPSPRDRG